MAILLVYIAIKIAVDAVELLHVPGIISFGIVLACLACGVLASLIWPPKAEESVEASTIVAIQV